MLNFSELCHLAVLVYKIIFKNTYMLWATLICCLRLFEIVVNLCSSSEIVVQIHCVCVHVLSQYTCCCSISPKGYFRVLLISKDVVVNYSGIVWSFNQSTAAGERAINTQVGILLTIIVVKGFNHTAVWPAWLVF